ncbi:MAG: ABC transporter ATP-binding protein [Bacteroidia bacterium]|nr:ABC transporter ATP-binding protein [Bacteroidia bacterium]
MNKEAGNPAGTPEHPDTTPGVKSVFSIVFGSFKMHLDAAQKRKAYILIALIFTSAVLDVFGIASILPLIKLATEPSTIHSNAYLRYVYEALNFESDKSFLLFMILSVLAFFIAKSIFGISVNYLETRFSAKLAYNITRKQFNKYFNLDFHRFTAMKSSVITHHILNNPLSYVTWIVMPTIMLISEFSILLLIIGGIAWYDITLFLFIAVIIGPATWLIYALLRSRVTAIGEEMNRLFPQSMGSLTQTIGGYVDIKLAHKEAHYRDVFLKTQKRYHQLNMASHLPNLIPLRANELVALLGVVLIFIYAIFLTDNSDEAIVMISLFAAAAYRMMPSLNRIISSMMYIRKNMTALQNLSIYPELAYDVTSRTASGTIGFKEAIEIRDLSFRFPGAAQDMLKDISIHIRKGEKIGIVGASGSGKTTLMNILLRFYTEQKGGIFVDGTAITADNTLEWRNMMGYVKQDIFLLDASIRDNIVFGDDRPDEERLRQAIRQASLEDLIKALPEGVDTMIGERGSRLSGGQRQRISIARSLYRNAEVLIFDEATSALDNQTEQEVSEAIDSLSEVNKTIFIIAHRITTLKNCDRIYELSDGKVSGVYQYQELLEKVI